MTMTFADALQSPALGLLLALERDGYDFRVVDGRLRIRPNQGISVDHRRLLREHEGAAVALVAHCLQGGWRDVAE